MRKTVYAICEQQRRRARSLMSTFVVLAAWIVSTAVQAGLSLTWSQTPKTDFLMTWLILRRLIGPNIGSEVGYNGCIFEDNATRRGRRRKRNVRGTWRNYKTGPFPPRFQQLLQFAAEKMWVIV